MAEVALVAALEAAGAAEAMAAAGWVEGWEAELAGAQARGGAEGMATA
jgi:hypothetical protein